MRKIIISASVLMCLSSSASAMDIRMSTLYSHKVVLDQASASKQPQGAVYLHAKIKNLEEENEQLRNSINTLRYKANSKETLVFDTRVYALVEENKRLSSMLERKGQVQSSASSSDADIYAQKLYSLQAENKRMQNALSKLPAQSEVGFIKEIEGIKQEKARLKMALASQSNYGGELQVKDREISSLQLSLQALKRKNITLEGNLKKALSENSNYDKNINISRANTAKNARIALALEAKLKQSQQENIKLKIKINKRKTVTSAIVNNKNVSILKKQNLSLRETISAQTDMLLLTDNATKTAERLLTENMILKRKLEREESVNSSNSVTAKELVARNNKLRNEVLRRNAYIKKQQKLVETVKDLRKENDAYAMSSLSSNSLDVNLDELNRENESLEGRLEKERAIGKEYRKNILKYQKQILALREANLVSLNSKSQSQAQSYKDDISFLQKNSELKDREIVLLLLENQDLNARIELVSENNKLAISKKELGNNDIVFVKTKYPTVNNVSPILDMSGFHIPYGDIEPASKKPASKKPASRKIEPEDILAQDIKPLSGL